MAVAVRRVRVRLAAAAVLAAFSLGVVSPAADAPQAVRLTPGQVALVRCRLPVDAAPSRLECNGRNVQYFLGPEGYLNALISEPCESRLIPYACRLHTSKGELTLAKVTVQKKVFPAVSLKVDPDKVTLSRKDAERVAREREIIAAVYRAGSAGTPYFAGPFMLPLEGEVTGAYGVRRVFNKRQRSRHLGTDFAADEGTPIRSSNRGRVVFTGNLFYAGNSVILDHGVGVFTIYAHLSRIDVKESDVVDRGVVIGLSGRTGRVTGPHLHWGVRVMGELCDGRSLVSATASLPGPGRPR
jgi:murein DD-endopeptidase MepM/ murein hydrolase activator NlpD